MMAADTLGAAYWVQQQKAWIARCGGNEPGYIRTYGSVYAPDHTGDGGEAIFAADMATLRRLEAQVVHERRMNAWVAQARQMHDDANSGGARTEREVDAANALTAIGHAIQWIETTNYAGGRRTIRELDEARKRVRRLIER